MKVGKHDRRVEDLFVDLQDGILLIKLLENLTKKKVPGFAGPQSKGTFLAAVTSIIKLKSL